MEIFSPSSKKSQKILPKFMASFRKETGYEPSDLPDSSIFPHTFSIEYFEAAYPEHLVSN